MSDYCVIVADGARARFFTLEPVEMPELETGPNLVEQQDLINPEAETPGQALWSDVKGGRNRSSSGSAHGYDDHRTQHETEFLIRFAKVIAEEAGRFTAKRHTKHLVLASDKTMLGFLREALNTSPPHVQDIHDLAKNLGKFNTIDIHQHLADAGLLPKRRKRGE